MFFVHCVPVCADNNSEQAHAQAAQMEGLTVDDFIDFVRDVGIPIGILVLVSLAFIYVFCAIGAQMTFPGESAKIEQLRKDASTVSASQSEDVVGQVVEINKKIVEYQRYNDIWWARLLIPNGWDDIRPIPVPEKGA